MWLSASLSLSLSLSIYIYIYLHIYENIRKKQHTIEEIYICGHIRLIDIFRNYWTTSLSLSLSIYILIY